MSFRCSCIECAGYEPEPEWYRDLLAGAVSKLRDPSVSESAIREAGFLARSALFALGGLQGEW